MLLKPFCDILALAFSTAAFAPKLLGGREENRVLPSCSITRASLQPRLGTLYTYIQIYKGYGQLVSLAYVSVH